MSINYSKNKGASLGKNGSRLTDAKFKKVEYNKGKTKIKGE